MGSITWNKDLSETELTPLPSTAPEKFLDILLLLLLFNLFFQIEVLYYSFNFHFYNLLLPFKKDPIFKANFIYIYFFITFAIFSKNIVFLRV